MNDQEDFVYQQIISDLTQIGYNLLSKRIISAMEISTRDAHIHAFYKKNGRGSCKAAHIEIDFQESTEDYYRGRIEVIRYGQRVSIEDREFLSIINMGFPAKQGRICSLVQNLLAEERSLPPRNARLRLVSKEPPNNTVIDIKRR